VLISGTFIRNNFNAIECRTGIRSEKIMSIRIVTDSTCDLPPELIDEHEITVMPLYINFGEQGFLDGIEITRQEFYNRLPDYNPPPTTATPSIDSFLEI